MTTYDLRKRLITLEELFLLAAKMPIQVVTKDGQKFVIEPAQDNSTTHTSEHQKERQQPYHDLDMLAGTWSAEDAKEFHNNIATLNAIDSSIW